jgi:hypothetical protein
MDERGDSLEMMESGDSQQPEDDPEALEDEPAKLEGDGSANEGGEGGSGDEEDDGDADDADDSTTADGTQQFAQEMQGSATVLEVRPRFTFASPSRPGSASAGCCMLGSPWHAIFTWEAGRLGSYRRCLSIRGFSGLQGP